MTKTNKTNVAATKSTKTYRVETYAADGHSEQVRVLARGLDLAAAKALADLGHGSWSGETDHDAPGEHTVIAYHESAATGCGGRIVVAE